MMPLVQTSIKRSWVQVDINKLDPKCIALGECAVREPTILEYTANEQAGVEGAITKFKSLYQCLCETNFHELAIFDPRTLRLDGAFQRGGLINLATDVPAVPR